MYLALPRAFRNQGRQAQEADVGTGYARKHAAEQTISLDLDNGVKVNYGKFGDLLAEVKAVAGGKDRRVTPMFDRIISVGRSAQAANGSRRSPDRRL